mmetsp:Transcript_21799/g.54903  ORF Transcript_21799/g.54903 Transcript_21799/m.54903 type:complete len:224 (+) Transcript_21799:2-673(+)
MGPHPPPRHNALLGAGGADVVDGEGRRVRGLVPEEPHHLGGAHPGRLCRRLLAPRPPGAPQEVAQQHLRQQHLPAAQRAAPANVAGEARVAEGRELRAVGHPHARAEVAQEVRHALLHDLQRRALRPLGALRRHGVLQPEEPQRAGGQRQPIVPLQVVLQLAQPQHLRHVVPRPGQAKEQPPCARGTAALACCVGVRGGVGVGVGVGGGGGVIGGGRGGAGQP